jgi:hypothetical protein
MRDAQSASTPMVHLLLDFPSASSIAKTNRMPRLRRAESNRSLRCGSD